MSDELQKKSSIKERSVAYPSVTLNDAIDFTSKLRDGLGKGPYSREMAAKALGHSSLTGPAARKVAALVQYGLLERNGNTYSQTMLAQNILRPLSDELRDASIQKAAVKPRLFAKLCKKFAGQALPSLLENIIMREGVSESAAKEVVRLFTESMKSAGILVNGVIMKVETEEESGDTEEMEAPSSGAPSFASTSTAHTTQATSFNESDAFVFEFAGGIHLIIPRTKDTSEAIADGGLKKSREALTEFAAEHMPSNEETAEAPEENENH